MVRRDEDQEEGRAKREQKEGEKQGYMRGKEEVRKRRVDTESGVVKEGGGNKKE